MGAAGAMAAASGGITLDAGNGGTVSQIDSIIPYNSTVGIRFNTNGTVETGKSIDGAPITWSSAGLWIDPTAAANGSYDVRFTNLVQNLGSGDWTTEAAADDIWIATSAQRTWLSNMTTAGQRQFTLDFEVRKNAGPPPTTASRSYTFNIENII